MFEKLFKRASLVSLHKSAPYANERERFLEHCEREGYRYKKIRLFACEILWAARKLNINPEHKVSEEQIREATNDWKERERCHGQKLNHHQISKRFIQATRKWLRFMDWLQEPTQEPDAFSSLVEDFVGWMAQEKGFAPSTIEGRRWYVTQFLRWYGSKKQPFDKVKVLDFDSFLRIRGEDWSRISKSVCAGALRAFLRFAETRGLCHCSIADAVQSPRVFSQENLPSSPPWKDVQSLIKNMETEKASDIRDRAIVMLFVVYGLRASEVSKLRIEDIDWENDRILIRRAKRMKPQIYPLVPTVGNAIAKYLKKVRPQCAHREVFITLTAPFRPMSCSALYGMVKGRITKLGILTAHKGPHSLRHACATHLMSLRFSLKEIGDHLGHRSSSATRIYAKVDMEGLREVAKFDLGDLQ
jgi:integrase/recombinase XerD